MVNTEQYLVSDGPSTMSSHFDGGSLSSFLWPECCFTSSSFFQIQLNYNTIFKGHIHFMGEIVININIIIIN